jgi:hypothetical protein
MDVCRAIQQELDRDFDATIWDQDVFRPTHDAIDSLRRALDASDAGIFVLTPDDLTETRGHTNPTARDNVIFELGMFLGRLGVPHLRLGAAEGCHAPSQRPGGDHRRALRRRRAPRLQIRSMRSSRRSPSSLPAAPGLTCTHPHEP